MGYVCPDMFSPATQEAMVDELFETIIDDTGEAIETDASLWHEVNTLRALRATAAALYRNNGTKVAITFHRIDDED